MASSTSSLLNFTVPLSDIGGPASGQGLIMPKIKYRFRVLFIGFGVGSATTEMTKQIMDVTRPSLSFDEQEIDIYNSKIHYAGKPKWGDITATLRDDMQGSVSTLVGQQIQKQFDFGQQSSASSAIDYKFQMLIESLDGGNGANEPIVLETWNAIGCYLKSVNYGEADFKSSDPLTIKLDIVVDNFLQTPGGIGAAVNRTLGTIAI